VPPGDGVAGAVVGDSFEVTQEQCGLTERALVVGVAGGNLTPGAHKLYLCHLVADLSIALAYSFSSCETGRS
jgi:hypothetical protein